MPTKRKPVKRQKQNDQRESRGLFGVRGNRVARGASVEEPLQDSSFEQDFDSGYDSGYGYDGGPEFEPKPEHEPRPEPEPEPRPEPEPEPRPKLELRRESERGARSEEPPVLKLVIPSVDSDLETTAPLRVRVPRVVEGEEAAGASDAAVADNAVASEAAANQPEGDAQLPSEAPESPEASDAPGDMRADDMRADDMRVDDTRATDMYVDDMYADDMAGDFADGEYPENMPFGEPMPGGIPGVADAVQRARGARVSSAQKARRSSIAVTVVVSILVVLMLLAAGGMWDRWLRFNDAADLQGSWTQRGGSAQIDITAEVMKLEPEVSYAYVADQGAKTLTVSFGNQTGKARYRFSPDHSKVAVIDGEFSFAQTLKDDIGYRVTNFFTVLFGQGELGPDWGYENALVLLRPDKASMKPKNAANTNANTADVITATREDGEGAAAGEDGEGAAAGAADEGAVASEGAAAPTDNQAN